MFAPEPAALSAILKLSAGHSSGDAAALLGKCEEGMIKCLSDIEESMARQEKALLEGALREALKEAEPAVVDAFGTPMGGTSGADGANPALQELDVAPPPGFAWTLKCIRSGAASAAAAIDISLSKIRRQGDWSASSMVPERKYIDAMVVSTDAARRFFGWLSHGA